MTTVTPLAVRLDGDAAPLPITPDALVPLDSLRIGSRVRCEMTALRLVVHGVANPTGTLLQGSTIERDGFYGVPATDADRVALANAQVQWFNTDLGWIESYYAPTGSAGLNVLGLVTSAPSGWYPIGRGPACILTPTAQVSTGTPSPTTYVSNWAGSIFRRGGLAWFTNNSGAIFTQVAGMYDVRAWTIQAGGTAQMNYHLVILDSTNTEITRHDGGAFPQNSSLFTTVDMSMEAKYMRPGDQLLLRVWGGSAINVHMGGATDTRGQLSVRYVSPPLVSN